MKRLKTVLSTVSVSLVLAATTGILLVGPGCGGGGGGSSNQGGQGNQGGNNGGNNGGVGNQGSSGGTGTPTQPSVTVKSIVLSPTNSSIEAGTTVTMTAVAYDGPNGTGNPVPVAAGNWVWTTSDTTIASVQAAASGDHATFTGKAPGTITVTVTENFSKVQATTPLTITAPAGNPGGSTTVVYNNTFDNGAGTEWSDTSTEVTPGTAQYPATKFLGRFGMEKPLVSLSLNNLPAHGHLTIEFDLFCIMSLDGNSTEPIPGGGGANFGPDIWDLSVEGGPTLLHTTFSNVTPTLGIPSFPNGSFQAYPDSYPGGSHLYETGAAAVNTLGYVFAGHPDDSVYHLKYTFAHTADAVKFNFGNQFTQAMASDEAYGLKNVKVTASP